MTTETKDYFLIGNLYSAALVSNKASVDWLCMPDFDSPSLFAKILDEKKGGSFAFKTGGYEVSSSYIKDTAIVRHTFSSKDHSFEVCDFMHITEDKNAKNLYLTRAVNNLSGQGKILLEYRPRPNYGAKDAALTQSGQTVVSSVGNDSLLLHFPQDTKLDISRGKASLGIAIGGSDSFSFVLEYRKTGGGKHVLNSKKMFEQTKKFWLDWVSRHSYAPFARDVMVRSAIALKLLQYYPTGAIVASPTTSLPEVIGGVRNWDYRYVWLRDATFTLYSLIILGCQSEAKMFFEFLEKSVGWEKDPGLELLYTIHGEKVPEERELGHLSGHKNSRPVRVGNDAVNQFQLDVYGTMIDFIYFAQKEGIKIDDGMRRLALRLISSIETNWKKKDQGLWEMRDEPKHFTHSKVASWVGINRALLMKNFLTLSDKEAARLEKLENEIKDWIFENSFSGDENKILQHPDTKRQDATTFLYFPLHFIDKDDPKALEIINQTCQELLHDEVFVFRYATPDGLPGEEGAFVLATFWLISALAIVGETDRALDIFRKFEKRIADSGLLSEEIDIKTGQYLGNFPQGFSHMGLIMAAHYIDKRQQDK